MSGNEGETSNISAVVVVTGASAGVGRATAVAFARLGYRIGLIARDPGRLQAVRSEIHGLGRTATFVSADIADPLEVEAAAEKIEQELGPVDIWVNNAMATIFAPFDQITAEEFRRATEVTYLGFVYGTMAALKRMKPRNRGVIVQVGSALAYRSIPLQSAYCGAKHAIIGFTDSIRSELIHDDSKVHITVVNLPAMNTPQFEWSRTRLPNHPQPVPPIFQPEVAAEAIVWASRQRRREVDVGLPTVLAKSVQKIAPGAADRYLARSAYEAQQTPEPVDPQRSDSLFSPVPGGFGSHGTFDGQARGYSVQFWLNKNRSALAMAAGGLFAAIGAGLLSSGKRVSVPRITARTCFQSNTVLSMAAGALLTSGALLAHRKRRSAQRGSERQELPIIAENRGQTLYAWRGPAMIILDTQGSTAGVENAGFFFRQTRYLRDLRLALFGEAPFTCSAAEVSPSELEFTYVYPEKRGGGSDKGGEQHGIRYQNLDLRVGYTVRPNGLDVDLRILNRWMERATLEVAWAVSADFADYDEVSGERKQKGDVAIASSPSGVRFRYLHPQLSLETDVRVEGPGEWHYLDGQLAARIEIDRQAELHLRLAVHAIDSEEPISDEQATQREERLRSWQESIASVEAPGDAPIASIANRSIRDIGSLALLDGPEDEWLAPAAGIPLYQSLWSRDALTTVWQSTIFDRGVMADAVLSAAGRLQGAREDVWRDEQPGRIARAAQRSPLARLNLTPMGRYYGDYAAPFGFILALGQLYAWSGEENLLRKHFDVCRRILDWAHDYGDLDGDGYLEYQTLSPGGPKHQGWRDAENAVVYADGRQVETPIATCEIQGYWFAAQQFMAVLSAVLGRGADARAYWNSAKSLKRRFNRDYWMAMEQSVALGLDPQKRQIQAVTSNAGQALTTGIVSDEHLPALIRRLFQPDLFSGWGIRTLSTRNPAYNPLSYHLGSVWPVENATLLFGLRRFGFEQEAERLARALYDLALIWRAHRIPECIGGYSRSEARHPGAYSQANAPQAWNQSVFPILLQTILGIRAIAPLHVLAVYPRLPDWIPEITVRNLQIGSATVSLRFKREANGTSSYSVLKKRGTLRIVDQPPFDSLTAGIWDRLGALAKSFY